MFTSMKLAHTAFVLFITGVILSTRFKTQSTQIMYPGSQIQLGEKIASLRSVDQSLGPTYRSICANILIQTKKSELFTTTMFPEKRLYLNEGTSILSNTKIAIQTNFVSDIYMLIGTSGNQSGCYLTIMELPFICCIWFGFVFGSFAGLFSLKLQLKEPKLSWV